MTEGKLDLSDLMEEEEDQDTGVIDRKRRLFTREIKSLLYAFGNNENILPETVSMVEEIAVKYILDMTKKAINVGRVGKISVDDILYLLRHDTKKFSRVKELLLLNEELRRARKALDEDEFCIMNK